jgi:hypothetical protein
MINSIQPAESAEEARRFAGPKPVLWVFRDTRSEWTVHRE